MRLIFTSRMDFGYNEEVLDQNRTCGRKIRVDKIPAYERVYRHLKQQIMDGDYAIGENIPPEPQLQIDFDVSRTTVRKAVEMLVQEGIVEVRQGKGTRVLDYKIVQSMNFVTSFTESLKKRGYVVRSAEITIDRLPASPSRALELRIAAGEELVRIRRVQLADNRPAGILINYVPAVLVPNIEKYTNTFHSLYQFLEDVYGIAIQSSRDVITARALDEAEAFLLGVKPGTPAMYDKRVTYSGTRPISIDRMVALADKYEIVIDMKGRLKE